MLDSYMKLLDAKVKQNYIKQLSAEVLSVAKITNKWLEEKGETSESVYNVD